MKAPPLKKFWALIGLLILVHQWTFAGVSAAKPNILFIMTDQQHANMLSAAGNPYLKTHALDGLAASGIRFKNAYVANPVCYPSRTAMMSGVMPGRFGIYDNNSRPKISEQSASQGLGRLMKNAGYATFYGGKTHLPDAFNPTKAVFDVISKGQGASMAKEAIQFMTKQRSEPFFVVASFINPHDICYAYGAREGKKTKKQVVDLLTQAASMPENQLPPVPENTAIPELEPDAVDASLKTDATTPAKVVRDEYTDRDWRNYRWVYCRLTETVDAEIGLILDALKENGLEENTVVIFTSDHGDMDGSHRLMSKNVFYENSVKVPFIMSYKGKIVEGVVNDERLVSTGLDLLPTICEYAGIPIPSGLLGRSLKQPAETMKDNARRPYVVSENETGRMLRSARYKYCVYPEGKIRESLVDLEKDPGEMTNLALNPEYASVLAEHRKMLLDWAHESNDQQALEYLIEP